MLEVNMKTYYVYILLCGDDSYYTGITNDLIRRMHEHIDGRNLNAYTYNRLPLELVYYEVFTRPILAIAREKQLKGRTRVKKEALINNQQDKLPLLAKKAG